jgi:hypothetical protein
VLTKTAMGRWPLPPHEPRSLAGRLKWALAKRPIGSGETHLSRLGARAALTVFGCSRVNARLVYFVTHASTTALSLSGSRSPCAARSMMRRATLSAANPRSIRAWWFTWNRVAGWKGRAAGQSINRADLARSVTPPLREPRHVANSANVGKARKKAPEQSLSLGQAWR